MKRSSIVLPALLIALAIGSSACKKESSAPSGSPVLGVKVVALNKNYALPVNTSGTKSTSAFSASIKWDTAYMTVSRVKYEAEMNSTMTKHDSIRIEYEWKGPQVINLFDTNIVIGNFVLQPGYYDQMELKINGFKHESGNKPVFYLHGIYSRDNLSLPVQVIVNEDIMFKTEKDSILVAAADKADFTSIIQLKLDELLADIQLSALDNARLTKGVLVISAESNTELYRIVMLNLRKDHYSRHMRDRMEYHMENHMN